MKPACLLMLYCLITGNLLQAQTRLTGYVNPFVGTGGHGHTFPGATTPFGMVQLSPDTRIDGSWDGCSGYHYSDSFIYGFSHTHLSGTGCSDYGDINFMPTFVSKPVKPITSEGKLFYTFDRKTESASPGYYTVTLDNGIKVELSASARTGIQKYSYQRTGYAWITLDLNHRDQLLEGLISETDKQTYSGFRRSKAWAEDQLVYFYTKISRAAEARYIVKDSAGNYRLHLGYRVKAGESILVKTALSSVDEAGAKRNMETELSHWDFGKVRIQAEQSWEQELSRIKVYGGSLAEKQNFYTALYHCMIHPNVMNDVDGRYRGRDKQVHTAIGFNYYTVFSLWDTYRALHPLLNIIDQKRSRDFIMTFKAQYEQSGRLPMWELWGNETNCMIGFHSVSVILDAYNKKVISIKDLSDLYPAVKAEAMSNRHGLDKFRKKGFLSVEDESESVSKTLEYSYDMWCVAEIASALAAWDGCQDAVQKQDERDAFYRYSYAWKNLFNAETGFMTPRYNGGWIKDFDPCQVNNHFTEANAWQYRFAVPHHYREYVHDNMVSRMFNMPSVSTGRQQSDITGLMGQYAHGNEPSHHIAYLFRQKKSSDSTAKYVDRICKEMYRPEPDGLCGNEDCGQMSAWYVFSAMGFYPVNPSQNEYTYGKMLFDSVSLRYQDKYIQIAPYQNADSAEKSKLHYAYCFKPSDRYTNYHRYTFQEPVIEEGKKPRFDRVVSAPLILSEKQVFDDSLKVILSNNTEPGGSWSYIYYTLDGSEPDRQSKFCNQTCTLSLQQSGSIKAINDYSQTVTAHFYKRPNRYSIQIRYPYNPQYTAGGPEGMLDGLQGDADWRKGRWQGYQGSDFECVVDMKEQTIPDTVRIGFLQDQRSWIFFPDQVLIYGSNDSLHFEELEVGDYPNRDSSSALLRSAMEFRGNGKAYRYLKIRATPYGKLPAWHPGAGADAFIFVDEIEIRPKR